MVNVEHTFKFFIIKILCYHGEQEFDINLIQKDKKKLLKKILYNTCHFFYDFI